MAECYQYNAAGYFAGETDDYGGPLPNNATRIAPHEQEGHVPRWSGSAWEQVENHMGEAGYVHGAPFTIKDYGPYPEGWSATPPPPTLEEARAAKSAEIVSGADAAKGKLSAKYSQIEESTWPEQEAGARAILDDRANVRDITARLILADTAATADAQALVERLAEIDGATPADFARRITDNADKAQQLGMLTLSEQRGFEAALRAARCVEDVAGIAVVYTVQP
jgi:hypothetical protein